MSIDGSEPVTVQEAMEHCRVTEATEETYLAGLISAAREFIEGQTGLCLVAQTRMLVANAWASGFNLSRTPAATVSSVKYLPDGGGAETTLASANYHLDLYSQPSRIQFSDDFSEPDLEEWNDAIRITYTAAPYSEISQAKAALLLLVHYLYDNRMPVNVGNIVNELPHHYKAFIDSLRIGGFVA
jgi:uncharacterized phiE125 gp8 family phage protein